MTQPQAVLVVGAGDATGGAIARRFARERFIACVTRRGANALALVAQIEREIAPIGVAVFNIGADVRFGVTETAERVYRKVCEMGALVCFLMGREVARVMRRAETAASLNPDHIADNGWLLHNQPRSAWTHELDLRPCRKS